MKAVILAGGRGTRLAPFTDALPKALVPLGDQPVLGHILRQLRGHGFDDITLAVGHRAELLREHFGDGSRLGVSIRYSHEAEPLGTAGPLGLVPGLDQRFLVMNGDIVTSFDFADFVARHADSGALCTIGVTPREVPIDLGVIEFDAQHRLTTYAEKPVHVYHASMGVYVFEPRALAYVPVNRRLDLPDLMKQLVAAGEDVRCHPFAGYWRDIGSPDDYAQALADLARLGPAFPSGA